MDPLLIIYLTSYHILRKNTIALYNKVVGSCFVNKVCCIMTKTGTRLKKYKIQVFRCIKKRKIQEKYNPNGKKGQKKADFSASFTVFIYVLRGLEISLK